MRPALGSSELLHSIRVTMGVRLDEETWAEARSAWEQTTEPGRRIAARFGISHSTLYAHALRRGWAPRPSPAVRVTPQPLLRPYPAPGRAVVVTHVTASRHADDADGALVLGGMQAEDQSTGAGAVHPTAAGDLALARPPPAANLRTPDTPAARAYRLLRLIDLQLDNMETRMSTGEPMSAQDHERQARAFGALVEHAETAMEILGAKDSGADAGRAADGAGAADADRLRREIAQRLERLNAQWLAQEGSGAPVA